MGPSLVGAAANGHGGIYRGLAFAGVSFFVSATLLLRLPQKSDKLRLARAYRRGLWRFDPGAPRIGTCGPDAAFQAHSVWPIVLAAHGGRTNPDFSCAVKRRLALEATQHFSTTRAVIARSSRAVYDFFVFRSAEE